jgi:putative FmdB family regulatory protein
MPIYDLKCPSCNHILRNEYRRSPDEKIKCPRCRALTKRLVCSFSPHVFPSEGIFLEHASPEGKRFFSKREMREYEKKTGSMIGMLH